jgi:hypothetical protein
MTKAVIPNIIENIKPNDFICDEGGLPMLPAPPGPPGLPGIGERLVSVFVSDLGALDALGVLDLRGIYFTILFLLITKYNKFFRYPKILYKCI